jgi:hypothetical protein
MSNSHEGKFIEVKSLMAYFVERLKSILPHIFMSRSHPY